MNDKARIENNKPNRDAFSNVNVLYSCKFCAFFNEISKAFKGLADLIPSSGIDRSSNLFLIQKVQGEVVALQVAPVTGVRDVISRQVPSSPLGKFEVYYHQAF